MRRPYPHQREALAYARRTEHPALFMEMRLGKTLVAIRRARTVRPYSGRPRRALVVAPNSALGSWERELRAEGFDDGAVVFLQGSAVQRRQLLFDGVAGGAEWFLVNPEGHRALPEIAGKVRCNECSGRGRESAKGPRCGACQGRGCVDTPHGDPAIPEWDVVIFDESTGIKNPRARVTKFFLENFRAARCRMVLAGRPNPEGPLDLWSQAAFLSARGWAFGCKSYWEFRTRYAVQDLMGWGWDLTSEGSEIVDRWLAERTLVMSRRDAGMFREKVYERRELVLPSRLRQAYRTAEQDFVLELDEEEIDRTIYAMRKWEWLRQMCGGVIDGRVEWTGKVDLLIELLCGELLGQAVVVWFRYNPEIRMVADALRHAKIGYDQMTGATRPEARRRIEERFRGGWFRVLLMQQAVGQMGMDLSVASAAVYYSNHPGLLARSQTEDRLIHPAKKDATLYIDLVVPGTVDEDVLESLRAKDVRSEGQLARAVLARIRRRHRA